MQLAGHGQPYLSPSYRSCYNSQDTIADKKSTTITQCNSYALKENPRNMRVVRRSHHRTLKKLFA